MSDLCEVCRRPLREHNSDDRYNHSEPGRARHQRYNDSPRGQARRWRYEDSRNGRLKRLEYAWKNAAKNRGATIERKKELLSATGQSLHELLLESGLSPEAAEALTGEATKPVAI